MYTHGSLSLLGHSTQYIVQYLGSLMFATIITHQVMDASLGDYSH